MEYGERVGGCTPSRLVTSLAYSSRTSCSRGERYGSFSDWLCGWEEVEISIV